MNQNVMDKLIQKIQEKNSPIVMGIDPRYEMIPEYIKSQFSKDLEGFAKMIWFHSSPRKSDFAFMSADIRDADGIQNYAAIIIRLDNPNLKSIVAEFTETIQMLSQKPE